MVAPVTDDNSTTAYIYLPDDIFYDYYTHETVQGNGSMISKEVPYTSIPLYYKGGNIFAQRAESANTTTELRKQNFEIVIAPDSNGCAYGSLYLDDGVSIEQQGTSYIHMSYTQDGKFTTSGSFGYQTDIVIGSITLLGSSGSSKNGINAEDAVTASSTRVEKTIALDGPVSVFV